MVQIPVLTQAQCSGAGGSFMVRVSWSYIDGQTYFVAVVFDPQNTIVGKVIVDGSRGTTVASINAVPLAANISYRVCVAQCDASGNLTSSYSQPLNVLQAPLTDIRTTNDLTSVTISATLPAVGAPNGITARLFDANATLLLSVNLTGAAGVLIPPQPLDPARGYYVYVTPSSNQGLSTGGEQRADLQMLEPAISAISYDGANMTVSTDAMLPDGSTVSGSLLADGVVLQQRAGSAASVSFTLPTATLDMSKRYACTLRAVTAGNAGPASRAIPAVVAPARLTSAYYDGHNVGARWTVPPVEPVPTGAVLAAISDQHVAGTPTTTLGYQGEVSLAGAVPSTSLSVQINPVFGVAKGPPTSVSLPITKPTVSSVTTTRDGIDVAWGDVGNVPGYRLYLNDSRGKPISWVDTTDLAAALALPLNPVAAYTATVRQLGIVGSDIEIAGQMSDRIRVLAAAPTVTATRYDGAVVTVSWAAPATTTGITGYEAVLLHAETLLPTGASGTAAANETSARITVALAPTSRVVAAVRATGAHASSVLGTAVEVITAAPVITATDISATTVTVAWTTPPAPAITGYTVTISDDAVSPKTQTWQSAGNHLTVPNTLEATQVQVRVSANGSLSAGPQSAAAPLFGTTPSFYPQPVSGADATPYLIRSSVNQPAASDISFAFPNLFTATPGTLPSAGIFTLQANAQSTVLPYQLTVAADSVAWRFDAASRATLAADFLSFLRKMEMPDGSTVQIQPGALAMVRQTLALGLPLLFSEQLAFMYGLNPNAQTGGFVDLVPGMRLRIDSEIQQITPPANNQTGYVPAGTSTYEIQSYAQGASLFTGFDAFLSTLARPIVPTPLREPNAGGGGVVDLYGPAGRQPYFRLLYPSAIHDPKYSGLVDAASLPVLLGAASYNALVTASDQYAAQGNFTGLTGIFPFYFRGRAMLTPEIAVTLNGQQRWIALGSTVANLLGAQGAQPYCVTAAVGGFTMRRSIAALSSALSATAITTTAVAADRVRLEYPVATFTPTQPGYFGLPLFGGDDIRFGLGG